jgi:triosephosphate isomerase
MRYIFGNWKMYLHEQESVHLAEQLRSVPTHPQFLYAVFPNTLAWAPVRDILRGTSFGIGAQNVSWTPKGAYTGATSAQLFHESGASYALVGHSERRYIFGETDSDVRKKLEACIDAGITPVICIGEEKKDREEEKAEYRVKKQIMKLFEGLTPVSTPLIVAYEPVWAIGTGDACNDEEAVRMITLIKADIATHYSGQVAVLYGGSVDEHNAQKYLAHGIIDGVLIGAASTDAEKFIQIIEQSVL